MTSRDGSRGMRTGLAAERSDRAADAAATARGVAWSDASATGGRASHGAGTVAAGRRRCRPAFARISRLSSATTSPGCDCDDARAHRLTAGSARP